MMQMYRYIHIFIHIPDISMSQHIVISMYVYIYAFTYIYTSHHHPSGSISPIQGSGLGTLDAVGQVEIRYVRSPDDLTVGCFAESTCC